MHTLIVMPVELADEHVAGSTQPETLSISYCLPTVI